MILYHSTSNMDATAWAVSVYEIILDHLNMKQALDNIKIQRLERRVEKNKIPAFLAAFWRATALWIEEVWRTGTVDMVTTPLVPILRLNTF